MFLIVGLVSKKTLTSIDEAKALVTKDAVNNPENQIIMLEAEDDNSSNMRNTISFNPTKNQGNQNDLRYITITITLILIILKE